MYACLRLPLSPTRTGSGKIDSREFIGYFTSAAGRAAVAALGTAPSWHKAVADLSFSPDLPPAQRAQNGFKLWASEARFEHGSDEWAEEREESARTVGRAHRARRDLDAIPTRSRPDLAQSLQLPPPRLRRPHPPHAKPGALIAERPRPSPSALQLATDLAQWEVAQLDGISREQLDHLLTSKRTNLEKNSAFPMGEVMTERRRVEVRLAARKHVSPSLLMFPWPHAPSAFHLPIPRFCLAHPPCHSQATLEQRMAHLYKQPSADVLRKLPVTLSKPGGAASSLPSEPKTAGASSGGRRPAEPEVFDEDTDEDVP